MNEWRVGGTEGRKSGGMEGGRAERRSRAMWDQRSKSKENVIPSTARLFMFCLERGLSLVAGAIQENGPIDAGESCILA